MEIDDIRKICNSLPGATEDIKWEHDLCFLIEAKMFCVLNLQGALRMTLKVPPDQFEDWLEKEGVSPAPYLARAHWVEIADFSIFNLPELEAAILQSYKLILLKLPLKIRAKWAQ